MELAFPQEPGGTAATFTGIMHFVMAGVAALGTMVAISMLAFWFKNIHALRGYVLYSLISVAVIFLSGGLGAAAMAEPFATFWGDRTHHDFHVHTVDICHRAKDGSIGRGNP